jgi:hypothetical protein
VTKRKLRKIVLSALVAGLTVFAAGAVALAQSGGDVAAPLAVSVPAVTTEGVEVAEEPEATDVADTDDIQFESESEADDAAEATVAAGGGGAPEATTEGVEAAEAPETADAFEVQFIGSPAGNDQTGDWDGDYNFEG